MVKKTEKPKWLSGVVDKIHELATEKKVIFTHKAAEAVETVQSSI